jgi:chromosomal replication initiator protein
MSSRADKAPRLPVLGLARFGSRERCALATVDDIIAAVCRAHGITRSDLLSQRRYQHLFHARCVAAHLLRAHAGLNPGRIGMVLGMRDRTTIVHGLNRVSGDHARFAPLIARAQNLL